MRISTPHPIGSLLQKRRLRVLGINSGTSIDALDLALLEIRERPQTPAVRLLETCSYRYPAALQKTLSRLADADAETKELVARAHFALGDWIAGRVLEFSKKSRIGRSVDLIACHGQTIGHFPNRGGTGGIRHNATWQIGSPALIAHRTGVVTIGDFRSADIAAGGMGAPLSGYYHYLLFGANHIVLNLGGIANISAASMMRNRLSILAFDIGPANMMSDALARALLSKPYDARGRTASSGTPNRRLVDRILATPYFRRKPPKTCGREEFGPREVMKWFLRGRDPAAPTADLLATAVEITAAAVAQAVNRWVEPFVPVRSMILVGGGTRNRALVQRISKKLPAWTIAVSDELGVPAQYVEPAGFALLANETLRGRPGNLGGATGAQPAILGSLSLP